MNCNNNKYGYIYIRSHEYYHYYNAYKLGKTLNIPERDTTYVTGEIKRGWFEDVYEFSDTKSYNIEKRISVIERILQSEFYNYNIYIDGGKEFYKKDIKYLIEPSLIKYGIEYKRLTKEEIHNLIRKYRLKKLYNKINKTKLVNLLKALSSKPKSNKQILNIPTPREDQNEIIEKSYEYFQSKNKGLLVLMCGVGKTLISLWITQKLGLHKMIIGVPNTLLLNQWEKVISLLFQDYPYLIVSSGVTFETIHLFLEKYKSKCIIITTYSSSYKVYESSEHNNYIFDMKINDECHHLSSNNLHKQGKTFINMLKIKSIKQLSLTATLKIIENQQDKRDEEIVISNDNIEYFGEIIERKCLLWAINKNVICDYDIQTITTDDERFENIFDVLKINNNQDKRLFLSAYSSLESIDKNHTHHLLIYSNNKKNSSKIIDFINLLLTNKYFDIPKLYYSNYDSEINTNEQKNIIKNFDASSYGIISCVYCLGEGWDFPLLDGVVFAENMSSNIRIVQSALRACRKNKNDESKRSKIILPVLYKDDWLDNNDNVDLKKVKEVIYQMGLEDETIMQKVKVFKINSVRTAGKKPDNPNPNNYIGEYDEELTQKLRLKTIKRSALGITYEKARKIIAEKNITSKNEYYELCDNDIRLTKEPEIVYKGKFTNWIDYLSIERKYYDLETCKSKVEEYLSLYSYLKDFGVELSKITVELCKLDSLFPPKELWVEYYNVNELSDIIIISNIKKKRKTALIY
jgi:predicted helicase